jgi:hypothetical protein
VKHLEALITRGGDQDRVRRAGPAVVGQMQIGVETVSVAEERQRPAGHGFLADESAGVLGPGIAVRLS